MTLWPQIESAGRKIGYARVSTKDQKLRMQLDALETLKCHRVFEDHGVSGAKDSRPGLDRMLKFLKPGDTVVVFKLDRLGRSVLHLSDMLVRFQNEGIHFCSISEGINTTTPGGKLVYHLFSAFAEFQRDIIVENTLHGIEAARKKGKRIGRPRLLCEEEILAGHRFVRQGHGSIKTLAGLYQVSNMTVYRGFKRLGLELY